MAHAARLNLRMQKELKLLLTDPPPGVTLSEGDGSSASSLTTIEAKIEGPEGSVFSGGVFTVRVQITERYPFQPPNVTFVTPIYHPNIDNGGRICLDILNLPPKGAWQPSLNISTVLTSIGLLMSEPNPDDGLMCETSREYKYNRQVFDEKARSWTEKYAKAGSSEKIYKTSAEVNTSNQVIEDKREHEIASEHGPISEGSRKKICIRQKLSLITAIEKGKSDDGNDKENVTPVNLSCSLAKNVSHDVLSKPKPLKEVVTCSTDRHKMHKNIIADESIDEKKIAEAYVVLDSEDSEDDDKSFRKSKVSQLGRRRRRGEWKGKVKEEKNKLYNV